MSQRLLQARAPQPAVNAWTWTAQVLIFAVFFALYAGIGHHFVKYGVTDFNNPLLFADPARWTRATTGLPHFNTRDAILHPGIRMILRCIGRPLCVLVGGCGELGFAQISALISATVGGALLSLFFTVLVRSQILFLEALIGTCVLGCSSSMLVFASIPDVHVVVALSTTVLLVVAQRAQLSSTKLLLAGAFAGAAAIIGLVHMAIICYLGYPGARLSRMRRTAVVLLGVVPLLVILSTLEGFVFEQRQDLRRPVEDVIATDYGLYSARVSSAPVLPRARQPWEPPVVRGGERLRELLQSMLVLGVIAPRPRLVMPGSLRPPWEEFNAVATPATVRLYYRVTRFYPWVRLDAESGCGSFRAVGLLACGIWIVLLASAAFVYLRYLKLRTFLARAALGLICFEGVFWGIFGTQGLFLYSLLGTLPVVLFCVSVLSAAYAEGLKRRGYLCVLVFFLAVQIVTNGLSIADIGQAFREVRGPRLAE